MQVLFWLAAGLLVLHYFGYPLLLCLISNLKAEKLLPEQTELPSVTVLISVYNEEAVIGERMENCLQLDYPPEKLRILVVSDGSTDNTDRIVEEYRKYGIELVKVQGRVGKTAALNWVIPQLSSEVVIFTDANSMICPDAIKQLVKHFADPKVGAVCGELRLTGNSRVERLYWRFENAIKRWESRVSSLTVLNGALYALRRHLHVPMNPQAANDLQHPLQVVLQGYRCVYESMAIAEECVGRDETVEATRRVRIVTRGWKGLISHIQVLNPFRAGTFSFQFIARKLLRWLSPVLMLMAFGLNLILAEDLFYSAILIFQATFYGLATLGMALSRLKLRLTIVYFPYYFCLMNLAALKALWLVVAGRDSALWKPTSQYIR